MRDLWAQWRRGVFNGGFAGGVLLLLYSWWFVASNADIAWTNPMAYYGSGDFFYHFLVSLDLGLFHTALPLSAVLPMGFWLCDDVHTRHQDLALARRTPLAYAGTRLTAAALSAATAVLASSCLYILWLLMASGPHDPGEAAHNPLLRGESVHGWRAMPACFHVFVLESVGRLALSAMLWAAVATGLSALWPNRAFVLVGVFALSVLCDAWIARLFGAENTLTNLQNQHLYLPVPLGAALARQLACALAAWSFAGAALWLRFAAPPARFGQRVAAWLAMRLPRHRAHGGMPLPPRLCANGWGRLLIDVRAYCTLRALLAAAAVPLILLFSRTDWPARYSAGDLWLRVFSGVTWVEATWTDMRASALWAVLLSPVLLGNAMYLSRELGGRLLHTLHRCPSRGAWWRGKCLGMAVSVCILVLVMFASVAAAGFLTGARGFAVFWPDAEGFSVRSLRVPLLALLVFLLQALMLSLLQTAVHLLTGSMPAGAAAFLLPMIACLMLFASYDRPQNAMIPYNWGMLARSALMSPDQEPTGDGTMMPLANVPLTRAVWGQLGVAFGLFIANMGLIQLVRVGERDTRE